MQRRQLWFINAVLVGFAILMAARLWGEWWRGNERYAMLAERSGAAAVVPLVAAAERPMGALGEVISKNLFTSDRNNDRAQELRSQAQPPLPVVFGTMRLGEGYDALMAEAGQAPTRRFRRVKQGEQVGPFTVVEIRDEAVVVEYEGQRTEINVYQSANSVARAAATPAAPAVSSGPVVETSGTGAPPATSAPAAAAAQVAPLPAGDPTGAFFAGVKVTIEGNRRRFERNTAFGPQVWYEDIKK